VNAPVSAAAFETAVDDDSHFATIVDEADLLASLAISIREAGFRRDRHAVALHIGEMRMCGLALVKAYRALDVRGAA
jgi:hypothetical protein